MESKKAINDIKYLIMEHYSDKEPLSDNQKKSKQCFYRYCDQIKKDLERLEKQDKAIDIMKEKSVNLSREILIRKTYNEYLQHMKEQKYPPHYALSEDDWNLLKEVFNNG